MPELLESGYPKEPFAALAAPNPVMGRRNLPLQGMPPSISCPLKKLRRSAATFPDVCQRVPRHSA
jgi:hypothetical protein